MGSLGRIVNNEELQDGAYGLSSLSVKSRESNHLQMKLTKAALSTEIFKTPECWSGPGSNPRLNTFQASSFQLLKLENLL